MSASYLRMLRDKLTEIIGQAKIGTWVTLNELEQLEGIGRDSGSLLVNLGGR
jgi:hypothetical protein